MAQPVARVTESSYSLHIHVYFLKQIIIVSRELHAFSDVSEAAYAGVVYLRAVDSTNDTHMSLVIAKTKVAPIKRLTIPRLELNSRLLYHCEASAPLQECS